MGLCVGGRIASHACMHAWRRRLGRGWLLALYMYGVVFGAVHDGWTGGACMCVCICVYREAAANMSPRFANLSRRLAKATNISEASAIRQQHGVMSKA